MSISSKVASRIRKYNAQGNLGQTAEVILSLYKVGQPKTKKHVEGVALLAEIVAIKTGYDPKAAFFGGLLHDAGKVILSGDLFDGHNITDKEYEKIKTHAINGFRALKELHLFTALCAGLHHNLYKAGYGLTLSDFPKEWNLGTVKKLLGISMIVSVCDFIDAYTNRQTKIKDGSNATSSDLGKMLISKYPHDLNLIIAAMEARDIVYKKKCKPQ